MEAILVISPFQDPNASTFLNLHGTTIYLSILRVATAHISYTTLTK